MIATGPGPGPGGDATHRRRSDRAEATSYLQHTAIVRFRKRSPDGSRPIEDIRVGDWVLSRPEDDPEGPVVPRRVTHLFQTYAPLLDLHVGGHVIRTAAEHPFWVIGRGWTQAQQVREGDHLLGADGAETPVRLVDGPKESAPVYNLEVEEDHTYLVGSPLWGISVWAHNAVCFAKENAAKSSAAALYEAGAPNPGRARGFVPALIVARSKIVSIEESNAINKKLKNLLAKREA